MRDFNCCNKPKVSYEHVHMQPGVHDIHEADAWLNLSASFVLDKRREWLQTRATNGEPTRAQLLPLSLIAPQDHARRPPVTKGGEYGERFDKKKVKPLSFRTASCKCNVAQDLGFNGRNTLWQYERMNRQSTFWPENLNIRLSWRL